MHNTTKMAPHEAPRPCQNTGKANTSPKGQRISSGKQRRVCSPWAKNPFVCINWDKFRGTLMVISTVMVSSHEDSPSRRRIIIHDPKAAKPVIDKTQRLRGGFNNSLPTMGGWWPQYRNIVEEERECLLAGKEARKPTSWAKIKMPTLASRSNSIVILPLIRMISRQPTRLHGQGRPKGGPRRPNADLQYRGKEWPRRRSAMARPEDDRYRQLQRRFVKETKIWIPW